MAGITISSLDDGTSTRLRDHASRNGCSVEEEACPLICRVVGHAPRLRDPASVILSHSGPTGALDIALPGVSRRPSRERPSMAVLPDSMPAPDLSGIYPLRLHRNGFRVIPAMRPDGPREMRALVPGPGWPTGRGEA